MQPGEYRESQPQSPHSPGRARSDHSREHTRPDESLHNGDGLSDGITVGVRERGVALAATEGSHMRVEAALRSGARQDRAIVCRMSTSQ